MKMLGKLNGMLRMSNIYCQIVTLLIGKSALRSNSSEAALIKERRLAPSQKL